MKDPVDLSIILNRVLESGNYNLFIYLVTIANVVIPENAIDIVGKYCKMELVKMSISDFPEDIVYTWIKENRHFDIIEYLLDKGYYADTTKKLIIDIATKVNNEKIITFLSYS